MQKTVLKPPITSAALYIAAATVATVGSLWEPTVGRIRLESWIFITTAVGLVAVGILRHILETQKIRRERTARLRKLFEQKWEWQHRERTKPRSLAEEYPTLQKEPTAKLELNGAEVEINIATLRRAPSLFGDLIIKAALSDQPSKRPLVQAELEGTYKVETDGFKYDLRNDLPGRKQLPRF